MGKHGYKSWQKGITVLRCIEVSFVIGLFQDFGQGILGKGQDTSQNSLFSAASR